MIKKQIILGILILALTAMAGCSIFKKGCNCPKAKTSFYLDKTKTNWNVV